MPSYQNLLAFIQEQNVDLNGDMTSETSLIRSGLFDSLALLNLALWIEKEVGRPIDLTQFDLPNEWDTPADILNFIERLRAQSNVSDR